MEKLVLMLGVVIATSSAWAEQFLNAPLVTTRLSCDFCGYSDKGICHQAIDFQINSQDVHAASAGIVTKVVDGLGRTPDKKIYGNHVRIRHPNNYLTIYAHLQKNSILVHEGDEVQAGAILGLSDNSGYSSGPHLHFEVRDPQGNKVDPYGRDAGADLTGCLATAPTNPPCGPNALWKTCPPTVYRAPQCVANEPCNTHLLGPCGTGKTKCVNNQSTCEQTVFPSSESCNGIDDDCNGVIDDPWRDAGARTIGAACTVGIGECQNTGVMMCAPDGRATVCSADPKPSQEELCDGKDNNCDGEIDEPWKDRGPVSLGEPCTVGVGTCATSGAWECTPDGRTVVCSAADADDWPNCRHKECGDDGCGGSCGACNNIPATHCSDAHTVRLYTAECTALGMCNYGPTDIACPYNCENGACTACTPNCQNKLCGSDGCGGSCGTCQSPRFCNEWQNGASCFLLNPSLRGNRCEVPDYCELGTIYTVSGLWFTPSGQVSLRIVRPDFQESTITLSTADDGTFTYEFTTAIHDPSGVYYFFATDIASGITAELYPNLYTPREHILTTVDNSLVAYSFAFPAHATYDRHGNLLLVTYRQFGVLRPGTTTLEMSDLNISGSPGSSCWRFPNGAATCHFVIDADDTLHFCRSSIDGLEYRRRTGTTWYSETVYAGVVSSAGCVIRINSFGHPVIAFAVPTTTDMDGGHPSERMQLATRATTAWTIESIDDGRCAVNQDTAMIDRFVFELDTEDNPVIASVCRVRPYDVSFYVYYVWEWTRDGSGWHSRVIDEAGYAFVAGFLKPVTPTSRRLIYGYKTSFGFSIADTGAVWALYAQYNGSADCALSALEMLPEPPNQAHVFFKTCDGSDINYYTSVHYIMWNSDRGRGTEIPLATTHNPVPPFIIVQGAPYQATMFYSRFVAGGNIEGITINTRDGIDSNGDGRDEP